MKRITWVIGLLVCSFLASPVVVSRSLAADTATPVVGRVYHIEGDLLRYIPAEKDWVAVVKDAPFGTEDTLYSGSGGMAELLAPNGTWIRMGNSTQLQVIALDRDLSELDVAAGVARFYNKGSDTVIKATSPFGYVIADPGTVFDFYVGENSVEVAGVRGKVSFVHGPTDARYDVSAGSPSILADQNQVSSGEGTVEPDWDRWNSTRENYWAARARVGGRSVGYLPPSLRPEAYALEENGRWESVPYEGRERWFWRPTTVAVGWSPFTTGRWTYWNGDQTWIPEEPFGYVTHHYGNWVYARNRWYWAPPVVSVRVGLPFLNIGFFWSPGRVSWIHSGAYVGWVPLAPRETYYSHRNWGGPHDVVVTNVNLVQININLRNSAYARHAIVVPQRDFYGVSNYRNVRVANIDRTTVINNYRGAPVVNNTVINNYTTNKQRYNYTNTTVKEKPHNTVINRIQQNDAVIQGTRKEKAAVVQERVKSTKEGKVNREARIETPKSTNYIVPANEVNRPKSEIALQQKEIKGAGKGVPPAQPAQVVVPEHAAPARPGQAKQVVVPQHVAPSKPEDSSQTMVPEHVAPARPGKKGKVVIPEHATPAKATQKERPGQVVVPPHAAPAKPGESATVAIPEHVAPARTRQPVASGQVVVPQHAAPGKPGKAKQVIVPQHVAPAKPENPNQVVVPEHVAPVKPGQTDKVVIPEHATAVKPSQKEQPGQVVVPRHAAPTKPGQRGTVVVPEHVAPVKSIRQPERVTPAKPEQPPEKAATVKSSEKVKPAAKPDQKDDTVKKPDRVAPANSERQGKTKEKSRTELEGEEKRR